MIAVSAFCISARGLKDLKFLKGLKFSGPCHAVRAQPRGKGFFRHVAGGNGQHGEYARCVVGLQHLPVKAQKQFGRYKAGAFVAIDERVVARDATTV